MNFLAHIYLSRDNEEIRLGNFIGDYVKGRDYDKFPEMVRKGIILHRRIDSYTDSHPIVLQHKQLFYLRYHKYAGIVTDIIYDHFLSREWDRFSDINFDEYVDFINTWLYDSIDIMPLEMKKFVPNFIRNKWLQSYRTVDGIKSVLIGMSKGTSLPAEYEFAITILNKHYIELKHDFFNYFPQLVDFVEETLPTI